MTTALVTGYTTNKGAITSLQVDSYNFNLYDAVTYGGQTKYVHTFSGNTATGLYGGAFASSPIEDNVTIETPTAGTVAFISNTASAQVYIAGVYADGDKTLSITYNGETLTGGTWIPGSYSWVFGGNFSSAPAVGTVLSYQYVTPPPPPPPPSPGQTYIATGGRVPKADLTADLRDVSRADLIPDMNDKTNLIPS